MKTETRSFFSSSPLSTAALNWRSAATTCQPPTFPSFGSQQPLEELRSQKRTSLGQGSFPTLFPPGMVFPFRDSPHSVMASAVTDIPERRQAKRISCPEPRGWGKGVGGPICIFSINELELSSLAWGDNLRGKSLHILFKSTLR